MQKVGENAVYYLAYAIYYGRASRRDILFPGISAGEASSGVARVVVGIRVYGRVLGVLNDTKYIFRFIILEPHGGTHGIPRIPY